MSIRLLLDNSDEITIPMAQSTREAWYIQTYLASQGDCPHFLERLGRCFAASLAECMDPDFKPPTEAQLKHAIAIAREIDVPLESGVLRYQGEMCDFIERYTDAFNAKREETKRPSFEDQ